jgi:hypothetical protein
MHTYETVTEALADLSERGYTAELSLRADCLFCQRKELRLNPDEFAIDEVYRFEGNTDPADETIIYAISSIDGETKGTLVNAYGTYSSSVNEDLVSKLHIRHSI